MKKTKAIYLSKVFCVFSILLLIFAYVFSLVVKLTMPMNEIIQTTKGGSLLLCVAYIVGLMAISILAQKIALRLVKKPNGLKNPKPF
ncbi:hypothetical protein OMP46_09380 [Acinetobacter baumannii]|uniref:Uncharacterized protein n=1 Tax=Acinetobacter baumannii TaxID=470 RepID=A0AA90HWQ9_ACIBA|nr:MULTISPECIES: hypothetical protein [Acinetobacter]PZO87178.1 MAG: hypothetical protein DI631_15355 [Acinetobacter johnsonii]QNY29438.1 hypothetical protein IC763_20245 [Acinetobacter seifertii]MCJ9035161.1 hypothetical protein [Acinetobacter nosocomialis]MCW3179736.1 hypothetical protein [Acinetobacter baumannii]MEC5498711.1 hypothetical protein [Acinetobacter baumannii]